MNAFVEAYRAVARARGAHPAIEVREGDALERVTHAELWARAGALADALRALGIREGDVVALPFARSSALVIGMVAAWRAGAAWVVVEPSLPSARRARLLAITEARAEIVGTSALVARPLAATSAAERQPAEDAAHDADVLGDGLADAQADVQADVHPAAAADRALAYVAFTSGSSGDPKGVRVEHRGLVPMLRAQIEAFALDEATRALWVLSPSFDASVSDVGTVLLAGGTLLIDAPDLLSDPTRLVETLRRREVTSIDLPPSVLARLDAERLPSCLRTIVIGGEVADVQAVRRAAARTRVINVYGPTEATVCTSLERCDETWGGGTLGAPLPHVRYHLVEGELWIGGPCLARDYAGDPARTAERFVESEGARWYRTGDRVRHEGGAWHFEGRLDRQVKLAGRRAEPEEVEAALRALGVEAAVVPRALGGRDVLVAFVVEGSGVDDTTPMSSSAPSAGFSCLSSSGSAVSVSGSGSGSGSESESVSGSVSGSGSGSGSESVSESVSESGSGSGSVSVSRSGSESESVSGSGSESKSESKSGSVAGAAAGTGTAAEPESTSTGAGVGALDVVGLARALRERLPSWLVPARWVRVGALPRTAHGKVDHAALTLPPTQATWPLAPRERRVAELYAAVLGLDAVDADGDFFALGGDSLALLTLLTRAEAAALALSASQVHAAPRVRDLAALLDAGADPERRTTEALSPHVRAIPVTPLAHGARDTIVLTGATGFLGARLHRALRARGHQVLALVRAPSDEAARRRVDGDALAADVAQPKLGLSSRAFDELAARAACVVHLAAHVSLAASFESLAPANVEGTRQALALATRAGARFVYASTLSVFVASDRDDAVFFERDDATQPCVVAGGYAQSKWVAEQIARRAEVPCAIVRYGLLTPDRADFEVPPNDWLTRFVRDLAARGACPAELADDEIAFDATPVDHATEATVRLVEQRARGTFHVAGTRGVSARRLIAAMRAAGVTLAPSHVRDDDEPTAEATRLLGSARAFHADRFERHRALDLFAATGVRFDDAHARAEGIEAPAVDDDYLRACVCAMLALP
ncbi:MAG: AMP-binding protein [Myxococcales bacterium]|nr:AMP-binding protein [Myxococcales bacterium]